MARQAVTSVALLALALPRVRPSSILHPHRRVNNIAVYLSTSFAENTQGGRASSSSSPPSSPEAYIEARGRLVALWASQVRRLTLVSDVPRGDNSNTRLAAFRTKHGCIELEPLVASNSSESSSSSNSTASGDSDDDSSESDDGAVNGVLKCAAWGGARVLLTPCSAEWFGTRGPCCKFDHAARDFFASSAMWSTPALPTTASSSGAGGVEWLMYSDDDVFVRPFALAAFLANFDHDKPLVLGANAVAPRFRGRTVQVSACGGWRGAEGGPPARAACPSRPDAWRPRLLPPFRTRQ